MVELRKFYINSILFVFVEHIMLCYGNKIAGAVLSNDVSIQSPSPN